MSSLAHFRLPLPCSHLPCTALFCLILLYPALHSSYLPCLPCLVISCPAQHCPVLPCLVFLTQASLTSSYTLPCLSPFSFTVPCLTLYSHDTPCHTPVPFRPPPPSPWCLVLPHPPMFWFPPYSLPCPILSQTLSCLSPSLPTIAQSLSQSFTPTVWEGEGDGAWC